ncbi:MAG: MFS transporter [Candidatus Hermodarchaeota archaeon]
MLKSKKSNSSEIKVTPDFNPMIKIIFWNSLGFFFFSFIVPHVVKQYLGFSEIELGFVWASQLLGALLSTPFVGYITDKMSKKLLVLVGSFGRGIGYLLMYVAIIFYSLYIFAIGLFILGFFVGFFWSPLDTLISEKSHKKNRSYAFGKRGGMMGMGNLVGSIISFLIFGLTIYLIPENIYLVYSPLILFGASNLYAGIVFNRDVDESLTFKDHITNLGIIREDSFSIPQINDSNSEIKLKSKMSYIFVLGFVVLMFAFLTTNMNQMIATPYLQPYLNDDLNVVDPPIVMLILFPSQVIALLIAPKLGKLADKINPIIGITIISSFGSLITWLIINSTTGWIFSLILILDSTFAWGGMLVLQNVLSRISKSHRGKVFGVSQWISILGAIIGPIIGGIVYVIFGSFAPFLISIFIELSIIPFYIIAIRLLKPYMAEKVE